MDSDLDFISEIPQSIINTILIKLPIRDAVKTSILSSRWRYKWASLTDLVFDDRSLRTHDNRDLEQEKIVNFITRCLFFHEGPIYKFSLSKFYLNSSLNIDQWLLFISRKGIKELTVCLSMKVVYFRVPYSVFSCLGLTRLELSRCKIDLHPDFRGFPCLKYLALCNVLITSDDIEFLISSCPFLENLKLLFLGAIELIVRAPNLKHLDLAGEYMNLCLGSMPFLADISFAVFITNDRVRHLPENSSCTFDKFFGGVPNLARLTGYQDFTKYMSIRNLQRHNPISFHCLKSVRLYEVGFDDMNEVVVMLQILVNSPNLEALQIYNTENPAEPMEKDPNMDFWGDASFSNCTFRSLRTIKMAEFGGFPHEMMFIEFLLERSPSLEVMSIVPSRKHEQEGRLDMLVMLRHLVSLRRASTRATISI